MGLRINQNIAAMNAYRNLTVTDGQMSKSLEKLSSGFRINRAADDAAGLSISEGLRAQVGGLKVAVRNAQDGISLVQTAEGALTETHALLQRIRDLAVQASNTGATDQNARDAAASEVAQALTETDRIASATKFGGKKLLDGSEAQGFSFHVGAESGMENQVKVKIDSMNVTGLKLNSTSGTQTSVDVLDSATFAVAGANNTLTLEVDNGASNAVAPTNLTLDAKAYNLSTDSGQRQLVADIQDKIDGNASLQGRVKVGLDSSNKLVFTSTTAGSASKIAVTGTFATASDFGTGGGNFAAAVDGASNTAGSLKGLVSSGSTSAIDIVDNAIKSVSTQRANLGAYQNRLEHTIANLSVTTENLAASESRIRDVDMAQEMVSFQRHQILSQAGTAMLAQANQASQGVLSLLR